MTTTTKQWNTYTAQQIFTKIVKHLRRQGAKAVLPGTESCRYRNHTGQRCFIGCLIKPEAYTPLMEGNDVRSLCGKLKINRPNSHVAAVLETHQDLLSTMQLIHDAYPVHAWEARFGDVAKHFGLTVPPLAPTTAAKDAP